MLLMIGTLALEAVPRLYGHFRSAPSSLSVEFSDSGHGADSYTIKDVTPAFPWKSLAEAGALFVVAAVSILIIIRRRARRKLSTGASQRLSQPVSAPPTFIDVHLGPTISTGVYGANKSEVPPGPSQARPSVSERDVAKDACARLARTAIAACGSLLGSPSRATAHAVHEQFEILSKFWEIHGGLLDDEERTQLGAGLLHLGAAVEDTVISVDPTNLEWQRSVKFFLAAMERLAPLPEPSMRMKVLYANASLQQLGPNRLIRNDLLVQFHNTSPNPLTVYDVSTSIIDGEEVIVPVPDPLENNPETINFLRVRIRNHSKQEPVDMTRGIQVAPGTPSDLYWWNTASRVPLAAYPKDAKLRVLMSAMNQQDYSEDISFQWHLLLERRSIDIRELQR